MVQADEFIKHMRDFNKHACEQAINSMNILEAQTEKMMNFNIDQMIGVPEEGKNAAKMMVSMYKTGFDYYKRLIENTCRNGMSFQENPQKSE